MPPYWDASAMKSRPVHQPDLTGSYNVVDNVIRCSLDTEHACCIIQANSAGHSVFLVKLNGQITEIPTPHYDKANTQPMQIRTQRMTVEVNNVTNNLSLAGMIRAFKLDQPFPFTGTTNAPDPGSPEEKVHTQLDLECLTKLTAIRDTASEVREVNNAHTRRWKISARPAHMQAYRTYQNFTHIKMKHSEAALPFLLAHLNGIEMNKAMETIVIMPVVNPGPAITQSFEITAYRQDAVTYPKDSLLGTMMKRHAEHIDQDSPMGARMPTAKRAATSSGKFAAIEGGIS